MTIKAQQPLQVGQRFAESTPSGREFTMRVVAVGVGPKYRHGYGGRYVRLRREQTGQLFEVREVDVLAEIDWLAQLPDEPEDAHR